MPEADICPDIELDQAGAPQSKPRSTSRDTTPANSLETASEMPDRPFAPKSAEKDQSPASQ